MSGKELDLEAIEECWNKCFEVISIDSPSIGSLGRGASVGYYYTLGENYENILAPQCEEFAFNAPMFVSELFVEVKRLREEKTTERERVLGLIDSEIEDWTRNEQVYPLNHQFVNEHVTTAVNALTILRGLVGKSEE